MSSINLQSNPQKLFIPTLDNNSESASLSSLIKVTRAGTISKKWQSFEVKFGDGTPKKYRVKIENDDTENYRAKVQRNSLGAKICRLFCYDTGNKTTKTSAANLFANYAMSLKRISSDKQSRVHTDYFFDQTQIQSSKDIDVEWGNGYKSVLAPSVYIQKMCETPSDDNVLLVLDLDETISTDHHFVRPSKLQGLDPELKASIKQFKETHANGKVVILTQSVDIQEGMITEKLQSNNMERRDFDYVFCREKTGRAHSKKLRFEEALTELKTGSWSPKKVVFCDDQRNFLEDVDNVCEEKDIEFEGVQIHSARPYRAIKHLDKIIKQSATNRKSEIQVTESEIFKQMTPIEQHAHLMLTPYVKW